MASSLPHPAAHPAASSMTPFPDLPEEPYHPTRSFLFPKKTFGKSTRSCHRSYFEKWPWLTYVVAQDVVFCHLCVKTLKAKKMTCKQGDNSSFTQTGFSYWKDATISFKKHESSASHKEAVTVTSVYPRSYRDVGELLSSTHFQEKKENRRCLLKILARLKFLARQGIPLRGDKSDEDSNFIQLLKMDIEEDAKFSDWLDKKANKYVSHDIQNELLKTMALSVLRELADSVRQSTFYTIMCDECTDISNREQLVICIRWISNDDLEAHEDVVGLYLINDISAFTIVQSIKDALLRLNLPLAKCRGQCYDGASNMSGPKSGVAKRLRDEEPRALYLHCHGHALNLAASDAIKKCKVTKDALDVCYEVCKLIKFSPKRNAQFDALKEELSPESSGLRVLCPTRWTVRASSLKSLLLNYAVLQRLWETTKDSTFDPTMKSRIIGVEAQFTKFPFFFGVHLAQLVLKHTDNLSKSLQKSTTSASEGAAMAGMTVRALQTLRSEEKFSSFWNSVEAALAEVNVEDPQLPRRKKVPRRLDEDGSSSYAAIDVNSHYRRIYYEALDLAVNSIEIRFAQKDFQTYSTLEELLLKTCLGKDASEQLGSVLSLYGNDFDGHQLKLHLDILKATFPEDLKSPSLSVTDVKRYLLKMSPGQRTLINEVFTLLKLILVLPSTNAMSERSFSAMRRLKTYLRSTMEQKRLNHLLLLHVHKDLTDSLSCVAVANSFVGDCEYRKNVFGRFQ